MLSTTVLTLLFVFADCNVIGDEVDNAAIIYASSQEKMRAGQQREAVQQLYALARGQPWFGQAQWAIGQAEDARGNFIGAYVAYKRYLLRTGNEQDKAQVRERLHELEKKAPALAQYAEAEQKAHAKQWTETVRLALQVIEAKPKFALSYRLLGIAHTQQGHAVDAANAYARYLEADPDAPERVEIEEFLADYRVSQQRSAAP